MSRIHAIMNGTAPLHSLQQEKGHLLANSPSAAALSRRLSQVSALARMAHALGFGVRHGPAYEQPEREVTRTVPKRDTFPSEAAAVPCAHLHAQIMQGVCIYLSGI
jgi:hypothetical protein